MNKRLRQFIKKAVALLAHRNIPCILLPLFMILLAAGTIAQRFMGLHAAQKTFFHPLIMWVGPFPLPGGGLLLAFVTFSLAVRFIFHSPWRRIKAGINLTHLGVLLLLTGGIVTIFTAEEGSLVLFERETSNTIYDFHQRELVVYTKDRILARVPHQKIAPGKSVIVDNSALSLTFLSTCQRCIITPKPSPSHADEKGMARTVALTEGPYNGQDEENMYGLTLSLRDTTSGLAEIHVLFESMPTPLAVVYRGETIYLTYSRQIRKIPFSLKLITFSETFYPGTDKPRHYFSDVVLSDGDIRWPTRIELNKPLRYKGYTVFQSSFVEMKEGNKASILSVVRNRAWAFPYIGTGLLVTGLLLHFILSRKRPS